MPTAAELLARRALEPLTDQDADVLRTLTLTDLAAAAGRLGEVGAMIRRAPLDPGRSAADAAYVLAAQLHARTQDDFYPEGRVHVGAICLAAVLALADHAGTRTIDCLVAGYRALCDVAAAYSVKAQAAGLRPSGVFGPIGAAASAAAALGLSPEETANAIGLAAAACGGHNQAWISSTDEWVLEVGAAARAGVEAALFTRAGAKASPQAFEGVAGWAAAFFRSAGAQALLDQLGGPPLGPDVVAVKPYPVSGIAQVPTALACELHEECGGRRIVSATVHMSAIEYSYPGSSNPGPFTSRSGALMSVAFCAACGLLDGTVELDKLEHPGTADIADMVRLVEVRPDDSVQENEARVEVKLDDGRTLSRRGHVAQYLFPSWPQLSAAARDLARRSEAPLDTVEAALAELGRAQPDARVLRALVLGRRTAPVTI
jgi:2-methylcitrate dehydratase PrpD